MPDEGDIAQERYEQFLEARLAEQKHQAKARQSMPARKTCKDCGGYIPVKRRKAAPGCQRCIDCQKAFEEGG